MKTLFVTTLGLIGTVALSLVVRLHSQSPSPSPIQIVTSSGAPLKSLFEGVSPTAFGRRSVEQIKDIGSSRPKVPRVGQCRSAGQKSSTLLDETFGGAHLVQATCFQGQCAGHYAYRQPGNYCQNCATWICQMDVESGDPNQGCQEYDVPCGDTCCSSNDTCPNACEPGECF